MTIVACRGTCCGKEDLCPQKGAEIETTGGLLTHFEMDGIQVGGGKGPLYIGKGDLHGKRRTVILQCIHESLNFRMRQAQGTERAAPPPLPEPASPP